VLQSLANQLACQPTFPSIATRRSPPSAALHELFFRLKSGAMVIYPMEAQIELLIDAAAAGEQRVFGIEALSADPIFSYMAGGVVPSIDTIYRDLRRFDEQAIVDLEALMAKHGLVASALLISLRSWLVR